MLRTLRNLLLLEILAATVFVGIVASILLNRLAYYQEAAEKANMELVVSSLRSALRMRLATMMIQGRASQYASLAQDNPMDWTEQKPANYAGLASPQRDVEALAGRWVYDPSSRTLIYWVKHGAHFQPDSSGEKKIRLRVAVSTDVPASDAPNFPGALVSGARLILAEPYKWF